MWLRVRVRCVFFLLFLLFFQAEDGIRDLVRSRGLGDVYKRQLLKNPPILIFDEATSALDSATERAIQGQLELAAVGRTALIIAHRLSTVMNACLLYTSDAADERSSVDLGGRRIIKKKNNTYTELYRIH